MLTVFETIQQKYNMLATASMIWEDMVRIFPNITREHVASKLQKWRLKKIIQDPKFAQKMRRYRTGSDSSNSSEDESAKRQRKIPSRRPRRPKPIPTPIPAATSCSTTANQLPARIDLSMGIDALIQLANSEPSLVSLSEERVASMLMSLVQ